MFPKQSRAERSSTRTHTQEVKQEDAQTQTMLAVIRSVGRLVYYSYDLALRTQQARGNQECTTPARARPAHTALRKSTPAAEYKPCATATGPRRELPQAPTARYTLHTAARLLRCSPFSAARPRRKRGWNGDLMQRLPSGYLRAFSH